MKINSCVFLIVRLYHGCVTRAMGSIDIMGTVCYHVCMYLYVICACEYNDMCVYMYVFMYVCVCVCMCSIYVCAFYICACVNMFYTCHYNKIS